MIPRFPYLGMPYYNGYSRYGYRYPYYSYNNTKEDFFDNSKNTYNVQNSKRDINVKNEAKKNRNKNSYNSKYASNTNSSVNSFDNSVNSKQSDQQSNSNDDAPLFQIFGINLYFDDILLICLIWFLYDEGVKDESLFIALILLLLS